MSYFNLHSLAFTRIFFSESACRIYLSLNSKGIPKSSSELVLGLESSLGNSFREFSLFNLSTSFCTFRRKTPNYPLKFFSLLCLLFLFLASPSFLANSAGRAWRIRSALSNARSFHLFMRVGICAWWYRWVGKLKSQKRGRLRDRPFCGGEKLFGRCWRGTDEKCGMLLIAENILDAEKSRNRRCKDRSGSEIGTIHVPCDDLLSSG